MTRKDFIRDKKTGEWNSKDGRYRVWNTGSRNNGGWSLWQLLEKIEVSPSYPDGWKYIYSGPSMEWLVRTHAR